MKKSLFTLLLICSIGLCTAQTFQKGQKTFSPGFGLGLYGVGYGVGFALPVVANLDFGIHEYISVGAYGGFWASSWDYGFNSRYRFTSIHFGARGSFHFWKLLEELIGTDLKSDKFDIYVTPWLGYNIRSSKWTGQGLEPTDLGWRNRVHGGAQVGARYYFKENIAFFAEWGGTPTAWSNWGVTFRF